MTETQRKAMQQALEFLEAGHFVYPTQLADNLRAALAEPEPEPEPEPVNEPITDYWHQHYVVNGLCGLCGNRGVLDTRGTTTHAGVAVGGLHYCICPNGQTMRRNKVMLAEPEPVAPPARKPLTSNKDRPDQKATYVEGYGYVDTRAVRAIERAHGIGGNDE